MYQSMIAGIGSYVPTRVVTNKELEVMMNTTDQWIVERTGIRERRWIEQVGICPSDLGLKASILAIEDAGIVKEDIDLLIFATLSVDAFFPGSSCFMQPKLGIQGKPTLEIRNQCTGFLYSLSVADQFIRTGMYQNILVVGAEVHSTGLDKSEQGRDVSVLFGDGAGAVIVSRADKEQSRIISTKLHADGTYALDLFVEMPSSKQDPIITQADIDERRYTPRMNGRKVFKHAITKLPEVIKESLEGAQLKLEDIDFFIFHQANLRINEFVAKVMGIPPEKTYNNIDKYGNITAASIPLAFDECVKMGKIKRGMTICLAAFGAGFTWGSIILKF